MININDNDKIIPIRIDTIKDINKSIIDSGFIVTSDYFYYPSEMFGKHGYIVHCILKDKPIDDLEVYGNSLKNKLTELLSNSGVKFDFDIRIGFKEVVIHFIRFSLAKK